MERMSEHPLGGMGLEPSCILASGLVRRPYPLAADSSLTIGTAYRMLTHALPEDVTHTVHPYRPANYQARGPRELFGLVEPTKFRQSRFLLLRLSQDALTFTLLSDFIIASCEPPTSADARLTDPSRDCRLPIGRSRPSGLRVSASLRQQCPRTRSAPTRTRSCRSTTMRRMSCDEGTG